MIIDPATALQSLAALPEVSFAAGELMLHQGETTRRLLFLMEGEALIVRDEITLARVMEPGAVLGDMAVILGRPHSADVRAAEPTRCHVIEDAAAALKTEPLLALYVMTVLASRLDAVNGHLIDARQRLGEDGPQRGFFAETLDNLGRAMRIGLPV
jgi:CRP/FNR family transcriptional regulator, cyclic AMP receptor protein